MASSVRQSGKKTLYTTDNPYEQKFGYCRAVRKGPFIFVSGTTAVDPSDGKLAYPGDAESQAFRAFGQCLVAIKSLGGNEEDIVRVRMYIARQEDQGVVGNAYRQLLGKDDTEHSRLGFGCAATMIVVKDGFVDSEMLIEVEMDAVVDV